MAVPLWLISQAPEEEVYCLVPPAQGVQAGYMNNPLPVAKYRTLYGLVDASYYITLVLKPQYVDRNKAEDVFIDSDTR